MVHHDFSGNFGFRDGKWKLKFHTRVAKYALHDMEADPSEKENLYRSHPEVVERLEAALTKIVSDGRSTPGAPQENDGPAWWEKLVWMEQK
jgi:arylsulfatase A